jgi:formate-dependent nitrite reductase membrane component NrfD
MRELVLTRHNELVDPVLSVWGWEIPVYLFLGGLVAGMMIIAGSLLLRQGAPRRESITRLLPFLGLSLLSLGMLALFLDLDHKRHVWRLYTTVQLGSPMSWGAWILVLVYPALGAAWIAHPPALVQGLFPRLDRATALLRSRPDALQGVAFANLGLGMALGIYTGILLSSLGARPFWSSALLGPLFLVSGLSSAAALGHAVAADREESRLLASADNLLLAVEITVLILFLVALLSASQAHAAAARLVLGGPFTAVFWVLVVGIGIILPLIIQSLAAAHRIRHTVLAPIFVLAGGLALRFVIVLAGQYSHWPKT